MSELFKKKLIKKDSIGEFDFNNKSDLEASGLEDFTKSTLIKRNNSFFKSLEKLSENKIKGNTVARVVSLMEERFNSREISFLLAKSMIIQASENEEK